MARCQGLSRVQRGGVGGLQQAERRGEAHARGLVPSPPAWAVDDRAAWRCAAGMHGLGVVLVLHTLPAACAALLRTTTTSAAPPVVCPVRGAARMRRSTPAACDCCRRGLSAAITSWIEESSGTKLFTIEGACACALRTYRRAANSADCTSGGTCPSAAPSPSLPPTHCTLPSHCAGDEPPSLTTSALELGTLMAMCHKEDFSMFPSPQRCARARVCVGMRVCHAPAALRVGVCGHGTGPARVQGALTRTHAGSRTHMRPPPPSPAGPQ